jgi:hypothetical protein
LFSGTAGLWSWRNTLTLLGRLNTQAENALKVSQIKKLRVSVH